MICQPSSFSIYFQGLDSPLQFSRKRPALSSIDRLQHWQDKWLVEFYHCGKTIMALFFHSIASLVMAQCAFASLIFTSFTDVRSLVCVEPKYLNWPNFFEGLSIYLYDGRWSWVDVVIMVRPCLSSWYAAKDVPRLFLGNVRKFPNSQH